LSVFCGRFFCTFFGFAAPLIMTSIFTLLGLGSRPLR
jgi:hypothetical protein